MRILHVIYDDIGNPWLGGGGATRTLQIYGRIAQRGHRVTVLCGRYPGARRVERRRGVLYRRTGLSQSYVLSRLSFVPAAARFVKHGDHDIVVEDVSPFSPVGVPLWKRPGVPAVASVQNLSGAHASRKYGLAGWGPRLAERPLLSLFSNFVAVSPGIRDQLRQELGPGIRVEVVPNSVDPAFLESAALEQADRSGDPYVLSLGRIDVYQKGLDRLVQAFDHIAWKAPELRLVIAGGGTPSQRERLEALVREASSRDRIRLTGQVDGRTAARLVAGAELLAMPSRYEAWPLTALEAGAAGVPVVGSDIVGVRDAAPPYPRGHGLLVPDGDIEALAAAMLEVAANRDLRERLGRAGREWSGQFTWDALAERQLRFYEEIIV
jgi:glycosyltransferase involved in cell wall biosynthesis